MTEPIRRLPFQDSQMPHDQDAIEGWNAPDAAAESDDQTTADPSRDQPSENAGSEASKAKPSQARLTTLAFHAVRAIPLIAIWAMFFSFSWYGSQYREYYDERFAIIDVRESLNRGTLVSTDYLYGGVPYLLALAALIPEVPEVLATNDLPQWSLALEERYNLNIMPALAERTYDWWYLIRLRRMHGFIASLSIFFVFGIVLLWQRHYIAALLAAFVHAASWEVMNHSRLSVPDGNTMSFVALVMLLLFAYMRFPNRRGFLWGAAIIGGFVISGKYKDGLIVLPIVLTPFLVQSASIRIFGRLRHAFFAGALTLLSFIVVTPGVLLTPEIFARDVNFMLNAYGSTGFPQYKMESGFVHFHRLLQYVGYTYFSYFQWVALPLSGLAIFGLAAAIWQDWRRTLLLASFFFPTVLYLAQREEMYARNVLPQVVIVAAIVGVGIAATIRLIQHQAVPIRVQRPILTLLATVLILGLWRNTSWQLTSADTLRDQSNTRYASDLVDYIRERPEKTFGVSVITLDYLNQHYSEPLPGNLVYSQMEETDYAILEQNEATPHIPLAPHAIDHWFGPFQLNRSYYPTYHETMPAFWLFSKEKVLEHRIAAWYCNIVRGWGLECQQLPNRLYERYGHLPGVAPLVVEAETPAENPPNGGDSP